MLNLGGLARLNTSTANLEFQTYSLCDQHSVTSSHGYLSTPGYPEADYTPDRHCGCRLATSDPGIDVHLLDFAVNHTSPDSCDGDYLRVGQSGKIVV